MLSMRRPPVFSKPTGFSLVELMISIVVGLVVVGGVISVFASAVKSHTDNLRMTRLNQELRTTMTLMTRELRRAGYWGGNKQHSGPKTYVADRGAMNTVGVLETPQGQLNPFRFITIIGDDCITFSYDDDNDGALDIADPDERRGFGLDGGAVEVRTGGTACGGAWTNITDPAAVVITALTFTLPLITVDIDGVLGVGAVPCTPVTPALECAGGSFTPPVPTVAVNEIAITLTGQLFGDTSVTRTLKETVRVYQ